jgi:hypothetical protein
LRAARAAGVPAFLEGLSLLHATCPTSIRQHTSAYVSIRQHILRTTRASICTSEPVKQVTSSKLGTNVPESSRQSCCVCERGARASSSSTPSSSTRTRGALPHSCPEQLGLVSS